MRKFYLVLAIVLDGGGDIENLDRTAKKFLEYVQKFEAKQK